jgi:hypothetical protein
LDGGVDGAVPGNHDDGDRGIDFLDSFQYFNAFHLRHLDVAEDGFRLFRFQGDQAFQPVVGGNDFVPFERENLFHGVTDAFFVVYYKYF